MVESEVLKLWLPGVLVREELPCRPSPELLDRSLCSSRGPFGSLSGGDTGVGGQGWAPSAAGSPSFLGTGGVLVQPGRPLETEGLPPSLAPCRPYSQSCGFQVSPRPPEYPGQLSYFSGL